MQPPQHAIFREQALEQYIKRQNKDVLPMFITPPIFLCLWILLGLMLLASFLAWWVKVPTFTESSGIVITQEQADGSSTLAILVFLPAAYQHQANIGAEAQIQIGTTGTRIESHIQSVGTTILSPDAARRQYGLYNGTGRVITEPSIPLILSGAGMHLAQVYKGSQVTAQVQIGSQRVITLLPGMSALMRIGIHESSGKGSE